MRSNGATCQRCGNVQTLHKNASEGEKDEFLQEALLMSNFKHEHILQLLGVCLDNDPQFMILELMEGGDLLSYLRASRPAAVSVARPTCIVSLHFVDDAMNVYS